MVELGHLEMVLVLEEMEMMMTLIQRRVVGRTRRSFWNPPKNEKVDGSTPNGFKPSTCDTLTELSQQWTRITRAHCTMLLDTPATSSFWASPLLLSPIMTTSSSYPGQNYLVLANSSTPDGFFGTPWSSPAKQSCARAAQNSWAEMVSRNVLVELLELMSLGFSLASTTAAIDWEAVGKDLCPGILESCLNSPPPYAALSPSISATEVQLIFQS